MNRLSLRERNMLIAIIGVVFVLGNMMLLSSLSKRRAQINADFTAKQLELATVKQAIADRDQWAKRDAWLTAKQPKLTNAREAGVALLEQVKQVTRANDVLFEKPIILASEEKPANYQPICVEIETKSSWPALVKFVHAMQQPDQFIVFESTKIQIDPSDPTRMQGHFRIAKWYAPEGR
jgi:hypothetical protein